MKEKLYGLLACFVLSGTFSLMVWGGGQTEQEKEWSKRNCKMFVAERSAATAEQREGLYIFLLCKPAAAYEVQGSVKVGMTVTSNPLNVLISKCKKNYPSAEAILISDPNLQSAKADCIKFKE